MQRREFFRRSAIVAAGVVAADQLDLLGRLGWVRKFFAGADLTPRRFTHARYALGFRVSHEMVNADAYGVGITELMQKFQQEVGAESANWTHDFDTNNLLFKAVWRNNPPPSGSQIKMQRLAQSILALPS